MKTTIDRINRLSAERAQLYRLADSDGRGDPSVRRRIDALTGELESLWERRRQERAGRREGIDLFVDRAYEQLYGSGFDDVVAPPLVATAEEPETAPQLAA